MRGMSTQDRSTEKLVDQAALLGIFGSIKVHPWVKDAVHDQDAYSLFHARAVSMGWAQSFSSEPGLGLWGMNEADQQWSTQSALTRLAWFQVGILNENPEEPPLPVAPLLRCAADCLSRVGETRIEAIQLLLPVHLGNSAWRHLVSCLNWFEICDPNLRTAVRITVDTGTSELQDHAEDIVALAQANNTGGFEITSHSSDTAVSVDLSPPVADELRLGSTRHPVTFDAVVPEWSVEALGWISTLLAGAYYDAGLRTTMLLNLAKRPSA